MKMKQRDRWGEIDKGETLKGGKGKKSKTGKERVEDK